MRGPYKSVIDYITVVKETIKGLNDNYTIEDILRYDNGHYNPALCKSDCQSYLTLQC